MTPRVSITRDGEYAVVLPWPPAKTSPNKSGQGKWREKSEAAKSYKATCGWTIKEQRAPRMSGPVDVEVTFSPPKNFRYDLDNMLARAKQGLDALADAIGVDDSEWRSMTLRRGQKVVGGCVGVCVRPVGGGE